MSRGPSVQGRPWRHRKLQDGSALVDESHGVAYRRMNACEKARSDGSLECFCLSSARSLCARVMAEVAMIPVAMERKYEVRVSVMCRDCRRRQVWSGPGFDFLSVLSLSKSLAQLTDAGISIMWQMEHRPIGAAQNGAFGAWPETLTPLIREAAALIRTGAKLAVSLTPVTRQGTLLEPPSTSRKQSVTS